MIKTVRFGEVGNETSFEHQMRFTANIFEILAKDLASTGTHQGEMGPYEAFRVMNFMKPLLIGM